MRLGFKIQLTEEGVKGKALVLKEGLVWDQMEAYSEVSYLIHGELRERIRADIKAGREPSYLITVTLKPTKPWEDPTPLLPRSDLIVTSDREVNLSEGEELDLTKEAADSGVVLPPGEPPR